jgi:hypothetical protein
MLDRIIVNPKAIPEQKVRHDQTAKVLAEIDTKHNNLQEGTAAKSPMSFLGPRTSI